jgi:glycosyltransferase involved in cell wall biosynthesis
MKKIAIYFDGGGAYSFSEAMGGGLRELINLAKMLSLQHQVTFYMPIERQWGQHNIDFQPLDNFANTQDVLITNNLTYADKRNKRSRVVFYQWVDYAGIPDGVDAVLTDTAQGVANYTRQGFKSILFHSMTPIGGKYKPKDDTKILFVGAIHNGKRPDLAILAVSQLDDYTLHVIGHEGNLLSVTPEHRDQDHKYIEYCKSICGDNILWHGTLPYRNMLNHMEEASVIIIPYCSDNEFNTNVAMEAIANGCVPIIADGLVDYLDKTNSVPLPNQRELTPIHIVDAIKTNCNHYDVLREKCWEKAEQILTYCKGEMIDAILGKA